jgi:hypothetical protein
MNFNGIDSKSTFSDTPKGGLFYSKLAETDLFGEPVKLLRQSSSSENSPLGLNDIFGPSGSASTSTGVKQRFCVRFSEDTKKNNGLREPNNMFNEYMKDVFKKVVRPGRHTIISLLAQNFDVAGLVTLRTMLDDLITRCTNSELRRALILPRGGQDSQGAVLMDHLPYLASHVNYLNMVIDKVRVYIREHPKTI